MKNHTSKQLQSRSFHAASAPKTPNMLKRKAPEKNKEVENKKTETATKNHTSKQLQSRSFHAASVHKTANMLKRKAPEKNKEVENKKTETAMKNHTSKQLQSRSFHAASAPKTPNMLKRKAPEKNEEVENKKTETATKNHTSKQLQSRSFHAASVHKTANMLKRKAPEKNKEVENKKTETATKNHTSKQLQSRSFHAASVHKTPNMLKRKAPEKNEEVENKKTETAMKNHTSKQLQSRSFHAASAHKTPHMLRRKAPEKSKEVENKKTKTISQSSKCFCGICFDFKPESGMLRSKCSHPFCTDCISNYVATQIQKNVVKVNCPKPNCCVELKPEYLHHILPQKVIVRWESARYESSIAWWQKTYCPYKNCSVLMVNDGDRGKVVSSSECPSCHRLFCAECKVPWHSGMNCKEFQKLKRSNAEKDLDNKFLELAKRNKWQRCPNCSLYVERQSGCEHMLCRCGCNFCYICGNDWKSGHLCYSHPST